MSNENEPGVSLEDARNTAESLFGDSVAAPSGELGEEQEISTEADQNQQGSNLAEEEQAVVAETARPEQLKVVVSIKDGRATIGVQRPSSDPYIESFDGRDASELAQEVPAVLERARAKWKDVPKHPAYERPTTPVLRRPRREQGSVQASLVDEAEAAQQETQTLRLF